MEMRKIILIALRVFQLLCACVVLGTSADIESYFTSASVQEEIKFLGIDLGGLIPILRFGIFTGVWGLIDALVGLASIFVEAIPWIAMAVLDALAAIFYLSAGIAAAAWLGNSNFVAEGPPAQKLNEGKAGTAFEFLGFLTTLALIGLGFMWQRGGRK